MQSTQALHDAFQAVLIETYPCLTFVPVLHIALAVIKAFRILCFEDPAWDVNTARGMYNLPGNLEQLSDQFELASSSGNPRSRIMLNGRPIFSDYAEAYRGIARWYITKVDSDAIASSQILTGPVNTYGGEQNGFDFWTQLSELTDGLVP